MASNVIFSFLLLVLLVLCSSAGASSVHFGSGVYLPNTNLGSPLRTLRPIFQGDLSSFLVNKSVTLALNDKQLSESSDQLRIHIAGTFGINFPIKVLRLSLEASYQKIVGSQTNVVAMSLYVESYNRHVSLGSSISQLQLSDEFMKDLRALRSAPVSDSDWVPYKEFLQNWGTHFVSELFYGSWMRQWSSASSSLAYTERQMQANACAMLNGGKVVSSIKGCAGVSSGEMAQALRLNTRDTREARGASPTTVASLLTGDVTNELLGKLIQEGFASKEAVKYSFTPVWTPVLTKYTSSSTREWQVATALQAYYEGFLAFSCPHDALNTPPTIMQTFRRVPSTGKYQCVRQCQGCRRDKDCHLASSGGCYCYGNSCINALGEDGRADIQTERDNLPKNVVPNRSCYYSFPKCKCNVKSKEDNCGSDNLIPIWDQTRDTTSSTIDDGLLLYQEG